MIPGIEVVNLNSGPADPWNLDLRFNEGARRPLITFQS